MSLDRQSGVFGRALSAWPRREKVSALDTDMKKIKSRLVTIVTDNVLRVGIVSNKTLLGRMLQERAYAASREETKKGGAMRQE